MSNAYVLAAPTSKLSWSHDWTDFLADGETVASRQWSIAPVVGSPSPTLTGDTSDIVFVEGLEAGMIYHLTETIVTSTAVEDSRTIVVRCDPT